MNPTQDRFDDGGRVPASVSEEDVLCISMTVQRSSFAALEITASLFVLVTWPLIDWS